MPDERTALSRAGAYLPPLVDPAGRRAHHRAMVCRGTLRIRSLVTTLAFCTVSVVAAHPADAVGSGHVLQFTDPVNDTYTIPGGGLCPFPVTETASGFIRETVTFDQAGNLTNDIAHFHLSYTDTAFGKTVHENFFSTRFFKGDITNNPDGTITIFQKRVGNLSDNPGGSDRGLFIFSLTFDPNTGQEGAFSILRNAGQIGGTWAGPAYGFDQAAYCAQFTG